MEGFEEGTLFVPFIVAQCVMESIYIVQSPTNAISIKLVKV